MSPPEDLLGVTEAACALFDSLQAAYAVGGAIAQNYWGIVRATQDADFLLSLARTRFDDLKEALERAGFVIRKGDGSTHPLSVEEIIRQEGDAHLLVIHRGLVKVEIFFPILPLQHSILRRAVRVKLGSRIVPVTTAEDLIVLKLAFGRQKDLQDVRGILWSQKGRLDLDYIREWAGKTLAADVCSELEGWIREYAE